MFLKEIQRALTAAAAALFAAAALAQAPVEVPFYYPIAVGGPIPKIIDGLVADFEKENPGIKLRPIYFGTYQYTITKALTAVKGGEPPVTSILLSTDMYTLIDEDAIVPFDEIAKSAEDQAWVKSFYPAFIENSQTGGKTWGIPFQRSPILLYWNKEMFKEAGLDPNRPPANWGEQLEYAVAAVGKSGRDPRAVDIARLVNVSRAAVSLQVRALRDSVLMDVGDDHRIHLTRIGADLVARIASKREVLRLFFVDVLGVDPETAERDACKVEHLISEQSGAALVNFISCLRADEAALAELVRRTRATAAEGTEGASRDLQAVIDGLRSGGGERPPGT